MPNSSQSRDTIVFMVLAVLILLGYEYFVMGPAEKRRQLAQQHAAASQSAQGVGLPAGAGTQPVFLPRAQAEAASPRVPIDTPALTGSIALKGARIDDLYLKGYHVTVDPHSPLVELFRPEGAEGAYFATTGWAGAAPGLPGPNTLWTAPAGAALSPGHPVTLTYDDGQGLTFTRTLAVDDHFVFTVTDQAANHDAGPASLAAYGSVQRQCLVDAQHKDPCLPPGALRSGVVHEGYIGWLGDQLRLKKYRDWVKAEPVNIPSTGGWLGITDKYWMASLIPDQGETFTGAFRVTPTPAATVFEADFVGPTRVLQPGQAISQTTHLYAGAKTVPLLQAYQRSLGAPQLDQAVDWGMFWFLTRPLFAVVEFFYQHVGNFGVAILLLTVTVRLAFFPLANKSYESMSKMKKIQPQLEALKKRNEKDPAKQQQEMMALYQKEKINPFLGCVPMLFQIPVFFSLYKVLSVTIEMRHAPFFGWVRDLSARDPTSLVNLFGLLPFNPAMIPAIGGFLDGPLHIGVWPLAYGLTMWLSMSMSPQTGMDPTQQKVMQFMPLIFMFTISQVAVGLMIYWSWSNVITIVQQYVIMRRFKVDNPIDALAGKLFRPKARTG